MNMTEDFGRFCAIFYFLIFFVLDIKSAHQYSSTHRNSILKSKNCGCFYCLEIFPATNALDWIWVDEDESGVGKTALCPKCGIDSVLGDTDVDFNKDFLLEMQKYWFS